MHIGLLTIRLSIPGAQSLKDRRRALRSIKDRLRAVNVAFAEIGDCEHWQTAELAIVTVTSDHGGVDAVLDKAAEIVHADPEIVVADERKERL